ncbi:MAG: IS5 family transposase [Myxococcota bacterium]
MAITDRHGLPIAVGIESGQRHEARLVDQTLESCFFDEVPETLIGDRAYDSRPLRESLARERGVRLVAPARRNTRQKPDGRRLRRYRRRWLVERLFSWLQNFRRLNVRWEHKAENFLGFVHLGCLRILLRRL